MDDLISRQAILKHIEKIRQNVQMMDDIRRASIIMNGMYLCEKAVRNQPPVQPERRKGKWIDEIYCSECGWVNEVEPGFIGLVKCFNFCPNCGADMRGEEE